MKRQVYCGFCGKHEGEVERLIDGPTVAICDQCIILMHGMLDSPSNRRPTSLVAFRKKLADRDRK